MERNRADVRSRSLRPFRPFQSRERRRSYSCRRRARARVPLADDLRARIARDGPMRARDFVAACIEAYYARGPEIGERGDFYTAANVSLFPNAMRRFVD